MFKHFIIENIGIRIQINGLEISEKVVRQFGQLGTAHFDTADVSDSVCVLFIKFIHCILKIELSILARGDREQPKNCCSMLVTLSSPPLASTCFRYSCPVSSDNGSCLKRAL
mmetsp:Transcript_13150/g.16486  ORF Transcript_13150/g.16486 Transcript_13150/m.16486 type:complete len:112 (-) Transcript_13150:1687-2022(-)